MKIQFNVFKIVIPMLFWFFSFSGESQVYWNTIEVANESAVCSQGDTLLISLSFSNPGSFIVDFQLPPGMSYNPGSYTVTNTGASTISSIDDTDLNNPFVELFVLNPGSVEMILTRTASCEAKDIQDQGGIFQDVISVIDEATAEVLSVGTSNTYQIVYGSLSISNTVYNPPLGVLSTPVNKKITIYNGGFGNLQSFTFQEITAPGIISYINYVIDPDGINFSIPSQYITLSPTLDTLTIEINDTLINQMTNTANNPAMLEYDEDFIIELTYQIQSCSNTSQIQFEDRVFWGCNADLCQDYSSQDSYAVANGNPDLLVQRISPYALDLVDTLLYHARITNTGTPSNPTGGSFAKDVYFIFGCGYNSSQLSTVSNYSLRASHQDIRRWDNFHINGQAVALSTLPNTWGSGGTLSPITYMPPNFFTSDPDGPGGLEDLDGDGFWDDLAVGEVLDITFDLWLDAENIPCASSGQGRYVPWEHLYFDVNYNNQCDDPQITKRVDFIYQSMIRDYAVITEVEYDSDISPTVDAHVNIHPYVRMNYVNCGGEPYGGQWTVAMKLPPGVILSPTAAPPASWVTNYNALLYQSNDTVYYVLDRYLYGWYDIPLEIDCASWDGSNPLNIAWWSEYYCANSERVGFDQKVHCGNVEIVPHCATAEPGPLTLDFSLERSSPGWTDENKTGLVDLSSGNFVTTHVLPYDTVRLLASMVVNDTSLNNLIYRLEWDCNYDFDAFNFTQGEITIVDIDGQYGSTNYTFPLTVAPITNNLGGNNYELLLDLSSYRTLVDPSYQYGQPSPPATSFQQDTVKIEAYFSLNTTTNTHVIHNFDPLRGGFMTENGLGDILQLDNYGEYLTYERPEFIAASGLDHSYGCDSRINIIMAHYSQTQDDYPNEYRPGFHVDSVHVDILNGWGLLGDGNVSWSYFNQAYNHQYGMVQSFDGDSLRVTRPANEPDRDSYGNFWPRIIAGIVPSCTVDDGIYQFHYKGYNHDYSWATNQSAWEQQTVSNFRNVQYHKPEIVFSAINTVDQIIDDDTLVWEFSICNLSDLTSIYKNWVLIEQTNTDFDILQVEDITSGAPIAMNTANYSDNDLFAYLDEVADDECKMFRITALALSCENSELTVSYGWNCSNYPDLAVDNVSCGQSLTLNAVYQSSSVIASISELSNSPSDPADANSPIWGSSEVTMCDPFPVELSISSAQTGGLKEVVFELFNMMTSGNPALDFISNSGYIEYPLGTPPRPFSLASNAAILAQNGTPSFTFNLSNIDPDNFLDQVLRGTTSGTNSLRLRFLVQSNCDIISGSQFNGQIFANNICNNPSLGNAGYVSGFPVNIEGITNPYLVNINTFDIPDFSGCNVTHTLNCALTKIGSSPVTNNDFLVIKIPSILDITSGTSCSSSACLDDASLTNIIAGGTRILTWSFPNLNDAEDLTFSFDVSSLQLLECLEDYTITVEALRLEEIYCVSDGVNCANSGFTIGSETHDLAVQKPIINLSNALLGNFSFNNGPPYAGEFSIEVTNTSTDLTEPVIVDVYCSDALGENVGLPLTSFSTSILSTGESETITGAFVGDCGFANGVNFHVSSPASDGSYQCLCSETNLHVVTSFEGEITGTIFVDTDGNDLMNGGESNDGILGLQVQLMHEDGSPIYDGLGNPIIATTNALGEYSFALVPGGLTYQVQLVEASIPLGYDPGTLNPLTGISVVGNLTNADNNFGLDLLVEICNNGLDDDEDGLIDCLDPDCDPGALTISCPPDMTLTCGDLIPDFSGVIATNNVCSSYNYSQSPAAGSTIDSSGVQLVVIQINDESLDTVSCQVTITIEDLVAPTITCPSDQSLFANNNCEAILIDYTTLAVVSDNCDNPIAITQLPPLGTLINDTTVVTLTATDPAGNFSECTFNVNLLDTLSPEFTFCPNDEIVFVDTLCQFLVPDYTNIAVANDNCDFDVAITQVPVQGTIISGSGSVQSILLTATDDSGNSDTCSFQIILQDSIAPQIISCANDIAEYVNDSCNFVILDYTSLVVAQDNCGLPITIVQSPQAGTIISGVGFVQPISFVINDVENNQSTCGFNLSLIDSIAPQISCGSTITQSVDQGMCDAFVTVMPPDITDNCDAITVINDYNGSANASDNYPVGSTTITWTVTDQSNNSTSCQQEIIVVDDENPSISCPNDLPIVTDANCFYTIADYSLLATVSDNCDTLIQITQTPLPGVLQSGTTLVTLMATDDYGNTNTCSFNLIVNDTISPLVNCPQDTIINLVDSCNYQLEDFTSLLDVSDNCDLNLTITQSPIPGTIISGNGTVQTIEFTIEDANSNVSSCSFDIVLNDIAPPIIICADTLFVDADLSLCEADILLDPPFNYDNCGVLAIVNDYNNTDDASGIYPVGTTNVLWTITDVNNHTNTCSQVVVVSDAENPTIICSPNITENTDSSFCSANVIFDPPMVGDNCGIDSLFNDYNNTNDASGIYPLGSTLVTWVVIDIHGNHDTCSQLITVVDLELPTITCLPVDTFFVDANECGKQITLIPPAINDNCGVDSLYNQHNNTDNASGYYEVGTTELIWTVVDVNGNTNSCTQEIVVVDNQSPEITCQDTLIFQNDLASCGANLTLNPPMIFENCGLLSVVNDINNTDNASGYYPVGESIITWTVTDIHNNTATCQQVIQVVDTELPTIDCAEDISGEADLGACETMVTIQPPVVADNCGVDTLYNNVTSTSDASGIYPVGTTEIIWTVIDVNGNSNQCVQSINIIDNESPQFTSCPEDITVEVSNACEIAVDYDYPAVTDNCSQVSIELNTGYLPGELFPIGQTNVSFIATDEYGNNDSCSFVVTVVNLEFPEITCPEDIEVVLDNNSCETIVTYDYPTTSNNCESITIEQIGGLASGDTFPLGETVIEFVATSTSGNQSFCSFSVNVVDLTAPVIICHDDIVQQDDLVYYDIEAYDNCDFELVLVEGLESGSHFDLGVTTIIYNAIDEAGNVSICEFQVLINLPPVAVDDNLEVVGNEQATFDFIANDYDPNDDPIYPTEIFADIGDAELIDGQLFYTPPFGYCGPVEITYSICDGYYLCDEGTIFVEVVCDYSFLIPNSFSPNNDGVNDLFVIPKIENYPDVSIQIFNVWGGLVFEADPYLNDWDGTSQTKLNFLGDKLPVGNYYYVLQLKDGRAAVKGNIYLQR